MADSSLVGRLKQGVPVWNAWKAQQPHEPRLDLSNIDFAEINVHLDGIDLIFCDLENANFSGFHAARALFDFANLQGANLSRADLTSARFHCADMRSAILAGARLQEANLDAADLTGAQLNGADLSCASLVATNLNRALLQGATLSRTTFLQTSLQETDFTSCIFGGLTVFGDVNLSEAKGLDDSKYSGGSIILDINSLYWSQGNIPTTLLRAAGVPPSFIALIPTLNYEEENEGDEHDQ